MTEHGWPAIFVLFVWWFSTGAVLYLDGLPRRSHRWSLLAATVVLAAALVGLRATADQTSLTAAYCAFACALLVWGWQELAFLTGTLTGTWRQPAPPGTTGWARAYYAAAAIIHHELGLVAAGAAVFALTWDQPNQVGAWTFAVLWVMRLSAKLNLFLGVRNLGESFLPDHLAYLGSFLRKRSMNLLFPVSVTLATITATLILAAAAGPQASPAQAAGLTMVGVLLALAVLEHWFMVIPLPTEALWRWGLASRRTAPPDLLAALPANRIPETGGTP